MDRAWSRFIPARAGNTGLPSDRRARPPVHPRPRGEHVCFLSSHLWKSGSSPPARGTRPSETRGCHSRRFIPARAGNTRLASSRDATGTVHPRPRGEHVGKLVRFKPTAGSSPPARGTPGRALGFAASHRFIPARAGNTRVSVVPAYRIPVHPRPRGEHNSKGAKAAKSYGSSPPARGTLDVGPEDAPNDRFIPARAGNTSPQARERDLASVHPRPRGEHTTRIGIY